MEKMDFFVKVVITTSEECIIKKIEVLIIKGELIQSLIILIIIILSIVIKVIIKYILQKYMKILMILINIITVVVARDVIFVNKDLIKII